MGIQFVLGSAGSGKTWFVEHEVVREAAKQTQKQYFVIVPEQFTMQTQKNLVELSSQKGMWNIEVQSFQRLAYRIFAETGKGNVPVIDDLGKVLILKKVLLNEQENLSYFKRNIIKNGYVAEIKSFLSELMQYGIEEDTLKKMITSAQGHVVLQQKLQDMEVAYKAFKDYLEEHYITSEEMLSVFADIVEQSQLLKGSILYVDGFTGFTPIQYRLLRKLVKLCEKVVITVTMDPREAIWKLGEPYKLFYMSKKIIAQMGQIAREEKVELYPEIWTGKNHPTRFAESEDLQKLEKNLFRYPIRQEEMTSGDITLHALPQPEDEVHFLLEEILQLRSEAGFRYRDVAVITGNTEIYGPIVRSAMEQAQIPCFIDQKKNIMTNGFVHTIYSVLDMLRKNFEYESVMQYVKSIFFLGKYSDKEREHVKTAIDLLDNYLLASGVRGIRKWEKEWDVSYQIKHKTEEQRSLVSEYINGLRQQIWDRVSGLYDKIAKGKHSVREYADALCTFMEEEQYYLQIENLVEQLDQQGQKELAGEYSQIYQMVLQVMDRLVEFLGDEKMDLSEFREIFDTGMNEGRIGLIPPGTDQIVVGDLSRTRLHNVKYLFFLGLNEGNFPMSGSDGGILSASEREWLDSQEYELAPTGRQKIYTEQFYLYLCLTKPSKHLYLCFCQADNAGKASRAAYVIERIKKIFTHWEEKNNSPKEVRAILGDDLGKKYLIQGLRRNNYQDKAWEELYRQYRLEEEKEGHTKKVDALVEAALYINPHRKLSREAARELYQDILLGSTSQFERFAACPFAYFAQYGMKLQERQIQQVEMFDIGNIIHEALERYTKKLLQQQMRWQDVPVSQQQAMGNACLDEVIEEYKNGILYMTQRNVGMIARLRQILQRSVWAITEQMKLGDFETVESEVSFYLMDGEKQIMGRVDRIDVMEDETHKYVRIVDYKSGHREISLSDLYYGLQMQLQIYLKAAVAREKSKTAKEVIPAGILYYNTEDPMLTEKVEGEAWETKMLEKLRMSGLINDQDPILQCTDHNLRSEEGGIAAKVKSHVVPVTTTSSGQLSKHSGTLSMEEMQLLQEYTEEKITEIAKDIKEGVVAPYPYMRTDSTSATACDYCKFHSVCGFDSELRGNTYKMLHKYSNEQVIKMIRQQHVRKKGETNETDLDE